MTADSRVGRIRAENSSSLLLFLDRYDIAWACGFAGSTGSLLVDADRSNGWCVVDGRYVERAEAEIGATGEPVEVVALKAGESPDECIARIAGSREVAVDPGEVTMARFESLGVHCSISTGASNVRDLRRVKDSGEVNAISEAARIADHALQSVVADGLCGRTESEIRHRLDYEMKRSGADDVSFPTIVASGPNAARPHHEPGPREVEPSDMVIIDMGAQVRGYRSDMTRTVAVGHVPPELRVMYRAVAEAQSAAIDSIKPGVEGRAVHAAARAVFEREQVAHEYLHSTGHGVGLVIHEAPILGPACTMTLREGEVVTAEPGLYRRGVGGVRIEDLLLVTSGSSRTLTLTPKELSCPPSPRMI